MREREALFENAGRDDIILPFQIDPYGLRGRLVRLGPVIDGILGRHGYPEAVSVMLGETVALAACLAGSLKYEGVFTLQTKGDGPIGVLMADVTSSTSTHTWWMPPEGERLRKFSIGLLSPNGCSSSILVLGRFTNTTVTPCSGRSCAPPA